MTQEEIKNILPHRGNMLLLDEVYKEDEYAHGKFLIRDDAWFLDGHFPGNPIMPGVLICEALAQVGAVLLLGMEENKGKLGVFTGINNFKFRRQVVPGDTLTLKAELLTYRHGMGKADVEATVDGQIAAKGEISFAVVANAGIK